MKKTLLAFAIVTATPFGAVAQTAPDNCDVTKGTKTEIIDDVELKVPTVQAVCTTKNGHKVFIDAEQYANGNWDTDIGVGGTYELRNGGALEIGGYRDNVQHSDKIEGVRVIKYTNEDGKEITKVVYKNGHIEVPVTINPDDMSIIAPVNKLLAKGGNDAYMHKSIDGDTIITYTDPVSGNTRHLNLSQLDESQLTIVKSEAKKAFEENIEERRLGVPVELDPLPGDPNFNNPVIIDPIEKGGNPVHGIELNKDAITQNVQDIKDLEKGSADQINAINESLKGTGYSVAIQQRDVEESVNSTEKVITITDKNGEKTSYNASEMESKMVELKEEQEERANERENPAPVVPIGDVIGGEAAKAVVAYRAQEAVAQNTIEDRVGSLETEMADMEYFFNKEIDRLDEKMDGVMASTQAVNAARPYLFNGQTSAVGVGIGAAGSEQAVAVGYAHRINENWSANANVSATSGNDTEVSAGAGVSFAW